MKKAIIKTLQTLTLCSMIAAITSVPALAQSSESKTMDLTLDEAKAIAQKSNSDIKKAELDIEIAEYKKEIEEDKENSAGGSSLETKLNKGYYLDQAEMNLAYANWEKDETVQDVMASVEEAYYSFLLKEEAIDLTKSQMNREKDLLAQIKTKVELGMAVQSDVKTKEIEMNQLEFDLKQLEYEKEELRYKFNRLIGQGFDTKLKLYDFEIPDKEVKDENLEELTEDIVDNNGEMAMLREKRSLASTYLQALDSARYDDDSDEVTNAKEALQNAATAIDNKADELTFGVYSEYNTLLNKKDSIMIKKLEINNLQIQLDILTKRFEAGLEVQTSIDEAKEKVDKAVHELKQAQLDYYLQWLKFENLQE